MRQFLFAVLMCAAVRVGAQTPTAQSSPEAPPEFGPPRGTLMIIGGGLRSESLLKQFIGLAGGPDASILLVPTAGEGDDPSSYLESLLSLERAGARRVSVLHTRDPKVADTEAFVAPIREAMGIFIMGGRHWRLADAYLNTRTHAELRALLDRGGVIAGTSAGATIQGSFMVRGLDPISWTPNERWIRCEIWTSKQVRNGRAGGFLMSSRPGRFAWSWTSRERSGASPASWI